MRLKSLITPLFVCAVLVSSCARKINFQNSSVVPAATGNVKVKKDGNNNYDVDLSIRNMAESKKLTPPRETYIVWMETERDGLKNIGQLNSSSGFLSSKLKASLKTVTPFKPTRIFITAEDNVSLQFPGPQIIISTGVF